MIRKRIFISAINEKLGLGEEVWGASEGKQKEAVVQGIVGFKWKHLMGQKKKCF